MTTYFIRRAGKIDGPYPLEKVLAEIRLKKLAKFHELSLDGRTWQKASELTEVFPKKEIQLKATTEQAEDLTADDMPLPTIDSNGGTDWYYELYDQEKGPVNFSTVAALVEAGTLGPTSLVWYEQLEAWRRVETIDALQPYLPSGTNLDDHSNFEVGSSHSNRSWVVGGIIVASLMIVVACGGTFTYYRSGDDAQHIAIESVLQNDQLLRPQNLDGKTPAEIANSLRTFVADAGGQQLQDCPPEFRVAYRRYLESMSALARKCDQMPDSFEEGFMMGMLNFVARSEVDGGATRLSGELDTAVKEAEASWRQVEDIALQHGVAL